MRRLFLSKQSIMLLVLILFMAVTRGSHLGTGSVLPDASLAVFFLAGFYLRRWMYFAALLLVAALVDYWAINFNGVSAWCVTPAYAFLIPTYASMWLGGLWFAAHHRLQWRSLGVLAACVLGATTLAFVISNGSFYLFSGRYADTGLMQYAQHIASYYVPSLGSTLAYTGLAAALHVLVKAAAGVSFADTELERQS